MAKNRAKAAGNVADAATESARMRMLRIDGSQNGATLRTRIVRDRTKYSRNVKHKKSFADAGDFAFLLAERFLLSLGAVYFVCFLVACGDDSSSKAIPDSFGDRLSSSSSIEDMPLIKSLDEVSFFKWEW